MARKTPHRIGVPTLTSPRNWGVKIAYQSIPRIGLSSRAGLSGGRFFWTAFQLPAFSEEREKKGGISGFGNAPSCGEGSEGWEKEAGVSSGGGGVLISQEGVHHHVVLVFEGAPGFPVFFPGRIV